MNGPRIVCVNCGKPTDSILSPICSNCAAPAKGSAQHIGEMIGCRAILAGVIVPPAPSDTCPTCNGVGLIGGPSYLERDEGGVPCPDCSGAEPFRWLNTYFGQCSEGRERPTGDDWIPLYTKPQPATVQTADWWRVEVSDSAGQIVGIEPDSLAGREIGKREEATIRLAIEHLSGFIGSRAQTPDYERSHEDSRELRRLCEHRDQLKRELAEVRQQRDDMIVDLARASSAREILTKALRALAEGCAFPTDEVMKAVRDRCRDALAKAGDA